MASRTLKRVIYTLLIAGGLLLSLLALYLLVASSDDAKDFDRLANLTLLVNAAGIVALLVMLAGNLARLVRDLRQDVPGAKLKGRMVTMFLGLALIPLLLVYYFSVQFINRGIDSWFNVEVEAGLQDALDLSRAAMDVQMRGDLRKTEIIVNALESAQPRDFVRIVDEQRRHSGATVVTLFAANSQIVATSSEQPLEVLPAGPSDEVLLQIRQQRPYVSLDPVGSGRYQIRTAAPLHAGRPGRESFVVQALYPVTQRLSSMADNVGDSYTEYKRFQYLRTPLKRSLMLTLTVVLLLSLLAAVYGAFFFSRRLVAPIQQLVAGTQAVAKGDFDTRLPTPSRDEIGFLVSSFNDMTRRLASAREVASTSQAMVEAERANLAVILARLSTGVISLESDLTIRTANQAAGAILGVDLENMIGEDLRSVARSSSLVQQFVDVAGVHLDAGETEWREQIVLSGDVGRRVLTCACSILPSDGSEPAGYVIVFDDITALLQAQRDAAWGEVARRLAHEIKNPLTPIQLSAERLRRKYLDIMPEDERQVLDRSTHTIVQQVEAMKEMVNAFSDYARAPDLDISHFNLNQIAVEVSDLYRAPDSGLEIELTLDMDLPEIEADAGRVRQILHNLIRNAVEALENRAGGKIGVKTELKSTDDLQLAEIIVEDNGHGFQTSRIDQVFDPYVTTKPKGTGLGLAIVKKLVEEHAGTIEARNRKSGGARISILLPLNSKSREAMLTRLPHQRDKRREHA